MKITKIETHTALFLNGTTFDRTLISGDTQKYRGLTLEAFDNVGVVLTYKGRSAIVPWTQIKVAEVTLEPKVIPKAKVQPDAASS